MDLAQKRLPKRWTEREDVILYEEVSKQYNSADTRDWHRIAKKLPGRTNKDCRKRWVNQVCGGLNKGPWKEEEDLRLLNAITTHGQKWTLISSEVGSRSADQCAKRWQFNLNPDLELGNWTKENDMQLLATVKENGREWKSIQEAYFPTRSRNDLKNRFTTLTRFSVTSTSDSEVCESPRKGDIESVAVISTNEHSSIANLSDEAMTDFIDIFSTTARDDTDTPNVSPDFSSDHDSEQICLQNTHWSMPYFLEESSTPNGLFSAVYTTEDTARMPGYAPASSNATKVPQVVESNLVIPNEGSVGTGSNSVSLDKSNLFTSGSSSLDDFNLDISQAYRGFHAGSGLDTPLLSENSSLRPAELLDLSMRIQGCDRYTLDRILDITQPMSGKVEMEIRLRRDNI